MHTPTPSTAAPMSTVRTPHRSPRIGLIDAGRGVAILAVIAYHLVWDLGDFDYLAGHPARSDTGVLIAHCIAGSFLFLVGVSLVLAHGDRFRRQAFIRRTLELVAYGVVISLATYIAMPAQWVSFGILQCIALVSVLALPFLWASRMVAVGAAVLAVALPGLVDIPGRSRWVAWTGLTEAGPVTIDHAPVLPLFALTLMGIVLMRTLRMRGGDTRLAQVSTDRPPLQWLAFLGRHTLVIYLLHQPILLGALYAIRWAT